MGEEFVTICLACNKGITKDQMKYVNGKSFHQECFEQHQKDFPKVEDGLLQKRARAKIDLVLLKNLQVRKGGRSSSAKSKSKKKRKPAKKTKKRADDHSRH